MRKRGREEEEYNEYRLKDGKELRRIRTSDEGRGGGLPVCLYVRV